MNTNTAVQNAASRNALKIVNAVLKDLNGRKGFDDWWDNIDLEIRREIRKELTGVVVKAMGRAV